MQNVPKIVRERLKAASPAIDHPDADMLTAFTERSLAEGERSLLLAHLARCGECRDIVALSLPATEPVERAIKAPARGWLAWPVLRWGFVAAGVMAIASVGIVQYQRGVRSRRIASNASPYFEVAAKEARNQPMASPVPAATAKKEGKIELPSAPGFVDSVDAKRAAVNEPTQRTHAEALPPAVPPPANAGPAGLGARGPLPHGPRLANQWQQQNGVQNQMATPAASLPFAKQQAAGELSANTQAPPASETATVESQSTQSDALKSLDARQIGERETIGGREVTDQPSERSAEDFVFARVDKAKPAESAQTANGAAPAMANPKLSQPFGGPLLASSASVPRWTINSAGSLQRSFDQGSTWQDVDVNAIPVSATSLEISAQPSRAKVKDTEKMAQKPAPIFRAVAASGTDVWAGGARGALYHSADAGYHWTHVTPISGGAVLTGDIVSLEFSDMRHGKVSTSTSEIWITSDDGQTWQKQ